MACHIVSNGRQTTTHCTMFLGPRVNGDHMLLTSNSSSVVCCHGMALCKTEVHFPCVANLWVHCMESPTDLWLPSLLEPNYGDQGGPCSNLLPWLAGTTVTKAAKIKILSPLGDKVCDHSRLVGSIWESHYPSPWTLVASASPWLCF